MTKKSSRKLTPLKRTRKSISIDKILFFNFNSERTKLGSEWENFVATRLRDAGLNIIAVGKGVKGSNAPLDDPRLSSPDFIAKLPYNPVHLEITGTRSLFRESYHDVRIQTGKLRYIERYSPIIFVRYFGTVNDPNAKIFWIVGSKELLRCPSQKCEKDVQADGQWTLIPKEKWKRGLSTLKEYLKSIGSPALMMIDGAMGEELTRQILLAVMNGKK